jgi:hypothetical protein
MATTEQQRNYAKTYRERNNNNPKYRESVKQKSNRWYMNKVGSSYGQRAKKQQQLREEYGAHDGMKKCRTCDEAKPVDEFRKISKYHDGLDLHCKVCVTKKYNDRYIHNMILRARSRARAADVPCTITENDITIPEKCPVLGIPLVFGNSQKKKAPEWNSPSIDRLIPELGYVPGNIAIISHRANLLKNAGTLEEHKMLVEWLTRALE